VPPPYTSWPYQEGWAARWRNRLGYAGSHWFIRPIVRSINTYRLRWGLPPFRQIDDMFSPLAQISQLCPGLDFPRQRLPDVFHYIGSLATDRRLKTDDTFPWDRLDGRRLIFASLGTVLESGNVDAFRNILAACADLDVQLVLSLGNWDENTGDEREQLGPIPANALVVDFAPQLALLDRASVLITHAGVNTVLESLSRAVPMVALPRSGDQPPMGARIAYAGVGLLGSFHRSTPKQIRRLVGRVLAEDAFRQRAKQLQKALADAGGVSRAADIAERAVLTRQPVRRDNAATGSKASGQHERAPIPT